MITRQQRIRYHNEPFFNALVNQMVASVSDDTFTIEEALQVAEELLLERLARSLTRLPLEHSKTGPND